MSTIEKHPYGCGPNNPLEERTDLTIISIVGDELCVDEEIPTNGKFRTVWKKYTTLGELLHEYLLKVDDKFYIFDRAI